MNEGTSGQVEIDKKYIEISDWKAGPLVTHVRRRPITHVSEGESRMIADRVSTVSVDSGDEMVQH